MLPVPVRRPSVATIVLLCAYVLVQAVGVHAQDASAAPADAGAADARLGLPEVLGETPLTVEHYGPEAMAERLATSDEPLIATLEAVLEGMADGPASISAAVATSADGRYELTALRIAGLDGRAVLTALFKELLGEQLRTEASDDPEAMDDLASRLEAILPWRVIEGRELVSPQTGADTTFELVYPTGDVLFLAQGSDGLTMAEVLAALPEQVP